MWPTLVLAVEAPPAGNDQLIVMIGGVAVAAIGAIATVLVALVNSRNRTDPSPPAPVGGGGGDHAVYERLAVLERRADDQDETSEVQDRRLDQIEDVLDVDNPRWRHLRERREHG